MTTIACSLTQMSGDSYLTDEYTKTKCTKVFSFNGGIIGIAGRYDKCMSLVEWFKKGQKNKIPKLNGVNALILTNNGIQVYEGFHQYSIDSDFASIGSGSQAAIAVMHLGYNTKDAVKTASKVDPFTGGRIKTLSLV